MYTPRARVDCCLKRIGKCKTRIEAYQKRTKLGSGDMWGHFCIFIGQPESTLFSEDDVMCQSCYMKVRTVDPYLRNRKRPLEPIVIVTLSPKTLRSSKNYHAEPKSVRPYQARGTLTQDVQDANPALVPDSMISQHDEDLDSELHSNQCSPRLSSLSSLNRNSEDHSVPSQNRDEILGRVSQNGSAESQLSGFSVPSNESQASVNSSGTRRLICSPIRRGEVPIVLPGIASVAICESRCFICRKRTGRTRIPNSAMLDMWMKTRILVPDNNRICKDHLSEGLLTPEAIDQIVVSKPDAELTGLQAAKWLRDLTDRLCKRRRPCDFNLPSELTDADYKLLTGIGMDSFNDLLEYLKKGDMRESANRTLRNALGIFLVMLRLNLSQRILAFLFGISNQAVISETIDAVSHVLADNFVDKYLGYRHLNREGLMNHMSPMYHTILRRDPEDLILILDGTYLYVEKSTNFYLQRRSYSSHKHRNLFKPMMVVAPDGYIIEAEGLYFSDGLNNDAKILAHMWRKEDSILSILQTRDCLVLDRGFRDVIGTIEENGVATFMPHHLPKGRKQFTTKEANESRKITKLRWVVEAANGRLKGVFRFFHDVIHAAYFPKLDRFLRIAIAVQNAYFPPLLTETEIHGEMAEVIINNHDEVNSLQEKVERLQLHKKKPIWLLATEDDVLEFPELTLEELQIISLGKYQMNVGKLYNQEHMDVDKHFKFLVHKDLPGIIRVRLQSRFSKRQKHLLWIEFEEFGSGRSAILDYYCRCKSGSRTTGCCSHVAAVLRYLSLDRFLPPVIRSDVAGLFLDAAEALAEDSEDEDEDDWEEEDEAA